LAEGAAGGQAVYSSAFYEKNGVRRRARALFTSALAKAAKQGAMAFTAVDLTYATRCGSHAEPVAILGNQFVRDLGYAAGFDAHCHAQRRQVSGGANSADHLG
jgi:hypothetical protein